MIALTITLIVQKCICGGAGSGKSYGATQKVLLKALKQKRTVLVIRKIQRTIKHSIWSLMLNHLRNSGFYEACRINRSDFEEIK